MKKLPLLVVLCAIAFLALSGRLVTSTTFDPVVEGVRLLLSLDYANVITLDRKVCMVWAKKHLNASTAYQNKTC